MKTMGYKGMVIVLFSMFVVGVSAQSVLTLKVTNVPSAKGKLMAATDKGQYNMVDAAVSDENGNYQLDREDGVPMEYCAIVDWEVKENTETVVVPLVDVRKGMKK